MAQGKVEWLDVTGAEQRLIASMVEQGKRGPRAAVVRQV